MIRALLYLAAWLVTPPAEWDRIKGSVARRVDPKPVKPQTFMPASHEEWKSYVRAEEL